MQGFGKLIKAAGLLYATLALPAQAAQFSATMIETQGEEIKTSKIFVNGQLYRMELEEGGEPIFIIVDQDSNITRACLVPQKMFIEMASDDMTSLMNDPFQSYRFAAVQGEEMPGGSETVNGYSCDKSTIFMNDQPIMTRWFSPDLGFAVKIIAHGEQEKSAELKDIKTTTLDAAMFKLPADYTKWVDPSQLPVEPPEWAKDIQKAPVLKPPFEQKMSAGDIARVEVEPGKALAVKATVAEGTEAVVRAIPFKEGRPLRNITMFNNFADKGTICQRRFETAEEADEFIIRAEKGDMAVAGKHQEMPEQVVDGGGEFGLDLDNRYTSVESRLVNLSDGESVAIIDYLKNGQPLGEDQIGPEKYRTITLKSKGDVDKNAHSANGDRIVFRVIKGEMLIKLGQFDSFKF